MTVKVSLVGSKGDVAAWAAAQGCGRNEEEFVLSVGVVPPDWFWQAMADGRLTVTNAKLGDAIWGQDGVDIGERHIALGETVRREDVGLHD